MNKGIVVIPAYRRPEFLHLCMERINLTHRAEEFNYLFALDNGYDKLNIDVVNSYINKFLSKSSRVRNWIIKTPLTPFTSTPAKQSFNVLSAYRVAAKMIDDFKENYIEDPLIILIEEDIMIAQDFFDYHIKVHEKEKNIFCSIGVNNIHNPIIKSEKRSNYFKSHNSYCSLGVCFKKSILERYVFPHCIPDYYNNMQAYVESIFPESRIKGMFSEQDGLIRRIQEATPELPIIYPCIPRAFHAGFYGKNRGRHLNAKFETKVSLVRDIIHSIDKLKQVVERDEYLLDSIPIPLDTTDSIEEYFCINQMG